MELIYVYIKNQGVLKNIGLSFSPYYNVRFIEEKKEIFINKNETFPSHFFKDPIVSITGIIGNNGSGKSTLIYWLLRAFVEGSGEKEPNGIILLKDNNGKLIVYAGNQFQDIRIIPNVKSEIIIETGRFTHQLTCLYYSGHFTPYTSLQVDSGEFSGEINISDKWLLIKDYQNFTNKDGHHLAPPLFHYLNAHVIQNAYRISYFLMDKENREKVEKELMNLPKFIIISPNTSGRVRLNNMSQSQKDNEQPINYTDDILDEHIKYENSEQELINKFVVNSYLNYISENFTGSEPHIKQLKKWISFPSSNDAFQDFLDFIVKNKYQDDFFISNLQKTLEFIKETSTVCDYPLNAFFYVDVNNTNQLKLFSDRLHNSTLFLSSRFFDLSYAINLHNLTKLSSGELELLNLLSRLYWHLNIDIIKFDNLNFPSLLILDEAEIGFHPEWQRKYLWTIVHFLKIFSEKFREQTSSKLGEIQIIYTTHSPITLSDLPKECVNFLEKTGDIVINKNINMPQTFGENVFELYRNSFFMNDGLLGKIAENHIKLLSEKLKNRLSDQDRVEIKKEIMIIGDERIRNYFLEKFYNQASENELDTLIEEKEKELQVLKLKKQRIKRNEKD